MAQLPCIGLSWPLTKSPFGSCAIYFHYGVYQNIVTPFLLVFTDCPTRRDSMEYQWQVFFDPGVYRHSPHLPRGASGVPMAIFRGQSKRFRRAWIIMDYGLVLFNAIQNSRLESLCAVFNCVWVALVTVTLNSDIQFTTFASVKCLLFSAQMRCAKHAGQRRRRSGWTNGLLNSSSLIHHKSCILVYAEGCGESDDVFE